MVDPTETVGFLDNLGMHSLSFLLIRTVSSVVIDNVEGSKVIWECVSKLE